MLVDIVIHMSDSTFTYPLDALTPSDRRIIAREDDYLEYQDMVKRAANQIVSGPQRV